MRSAVIVPFMAIILLLSGCLLEPAAGGTSPNDVLADASKPPAQAPPQPSTANLSFSRDASDVMNTQTKPFTPPVFDFANKTAPDGRLIVNYFYSAHCSACIALRPDIERLEAKYGSVEWREFDITTQNGTYAYQQFARELNLSQAQRLVPQVLVNGTVITDRFNINGSLEGIIAAFSAGQS